MSNDIENRFSAHVADRNMVGSMAMIRRACAQAAERIDTFCPDGREKSLAMTKLEEAMFWSNAAIAREGAIDYEQSEYL